MSARTTADIARHASSTLNQARQASVNGRLPKLPPKPMKVIIPDPNHGKSIWVYSHLQKNQVVYSLDKALRNNRAIGQLPYNGKKTVPAALRKDLWHPLATIRFSDSPNGSAIGLSAYQKLREYRRRHELEWDESDYVDKEGKFITKKKRGRMICDQKANSIADMAAVLSRLGDKEDETVGRIGLVGEGTGEKVTVEWRDLNDAQFAETWGDNVEHSVLEMHTNNRDPTKRFGRGRKEVSNAADVEDAGSEREPEKITL